MILPKKRDPRFITVRRGGTLQDADHHLLALWAADCAQHVLHYFEEIQPNDDRPRRAIELALTDGDVPSPAAAARLEFRRSRSRLARCGQATYPGSCWPRRTAS